MKRLLGIVVFFLVASILHSPQSVYISEGNIFDGIFTTTIETIYLIFFNGDVYSFSTHEDNRVNLTPHWYKTYIEERGRYFKEVAIIIHNHFAQPWLSYPDRLVLMHFRNYGFRGSFCIYVTSTKKICCEAPWLREIK